MEAVCRNEAVLAEIVESGTEGATRCWNQPRSATRSRRRSTRARSRGCARRCSTRNSSCRQKARGPVLVLISGVESGGRGETANQLTELDGSAAYPRASRSARRRRRRLARPAAVALLARAAAEGQDRHLHERLVPRGARSTGSRAASATPSSTSICRRFGATSGCWPTKASSLLKFWIHLSRDAQKKRIARLEADPQTSWRITRRGQARAQALQQVARHLGARAARNVDRRWRRGTSSRAPTIATAT